jgi:hypothetical protein
MLDLDSGGRGAGFGVGPYFAKFFAKFHPFFEERNFREISPLFRGFGEISAKFSKFRELGTKFRQNFVKFREIPKNLGVRNLNLKNIFHR